MAERITSTTRSRSTKKVSVGASDARSRAARVMEPAGDRQQLGISDDQIRNRAYHIFLARNGAPGDPFNDWVQAERELVAEALR